nr:helix-turn-helix transcriptional regulator [Brevibacillus fulvus]
MKRYRQQAKLSLSALEKLTGVRKGVISKIETGDTKHPEFKTIKPIARALEIPYEKLIEHYVEIEQRSDILQELLLDAIELSNEALIEKVATRFLQTPSIDTFSALQRLYDLTENVAETHIKSLLFRVIVNYSRERGVQEYVAKGTFQIYLIERDDFTRLDKTYQTSRYMLYYKDFLSFDERILLHYKLGVHAYNLRYYEDCVELCQYVLQHDVTNSKVKADSTFALCNSYYYLGEYQLAERYLDEYSRYSYPGVSENIKLLKAVMLWKKGNTGAAAKQLNECLNKAGEHVLLHVVNQLFELYMQIHDWTGIESLFQHEATIQRLPLLTPFKHAEYAHYHRLKGDYYCQQKKYEQAVDPYLQAALTYGNINDHKQSYECINQVLQLCTEELKENYVPILQKVQEIYAKLILN